MDAALARVRWDREIANLRRVASEGGSAEISVCCTTVRIEVPHPERRLLLQARCEGYPEIPPSYSFLNPDTRRDEGADYWPYDGNGAFKIDGAPPRICLPGTREYGDRHGDCVRSVTRFDEQRFFERAQAEPVAWTRAAALAALTSAFEIVPARIRTRRREALRSAAYGAHPVSCRPGFLAAPRLGRGASWASERRAYGCAGGRNWAGGRL